MNPGRANEGRSRAEAEGDGGPDPAAAAGPVSDALRDRVVKQVRNPCSVAAGRALGAVDMVLVDRVQIADDGTVEVFLRLTPAASHLTPLSEVPVPGAGVGVRRGDGGGRPC